MNDKPIEGFIYRGPGNCPECGMPLHVVDSELTLMELNPEGIPLSEETSVRCEAVCISCGKRVKMMRWKNGYVPYSRTSYILKMCELRDSVAQRVKKLNDSTKGKNPFSL